MTPFLETLGHMSHGSVTKKSSHASCVKSHQAVRGISTIFAFLDEIALSELLRTSQVICGDRGGSLLQCIRVTAGFGTGAAFGDEVLNCNIDRSVTGPHIAIVINRIHHGGGR